MSITEIKGYLTTLLTRMLTSNITVQEEYLIYGYRCGEYGACFDLYLNG